MRVALALRQHPACPETSTGGFGRIDLASQTLYLIARCLASLAGRVAIGKSLVRLLERSPSPLDGASEGGDRACLGHFWVPGAQPRAGRTVGA